MCMFDPEERAVLADALIVVGWRSRVRGSRASRLKPFDGDRDNADENDPDGDEEKILLNHFPSTQPIAGDQE